jgi:hypothetical protein
MHIRRMREAIRKFQIRINTNSIQCSTPGQDVFKAQIDVYDNSMDFPGLHLSPIKSSAISDSG